MRKDTKRYEKIIKETVRRCKNACNEAEYEMDELDEESKKDAEVGTMIIASLKRKKSMKNQVMIAGISNMGVFKVTVYNLAKVFGLDSDESISSLYSRMAKAVSETIEEQDGEERADKFREAVLYDLMEDTDIEDLSSIIRKFKEKNENNKKED